MAGENLDHAVFAALGKGGGNVGWHTEPRRVLPPVVRDLRLALVALVDRVA